MQLLGQDVVHGRRCVVFGLVGLRIVFGNELRDLAFRVGDQADLADAGGACLHAEWILALIEAAGAQVAFPHDAALLLQDGYLVGAGIAAGVASDANVLIH